MTVASQLVERLYIGYSYDSVHLPLLLAGYGGGGHHNREFAIMTDSPAKHRIQSE